MISTKEMTKLENQSVEKGISKLKLMENAGYGLYQNLKHDFELDNKIILIICGHGNNGGDGFVIARHLFQLGANVTVLLAGKLADLKDNAKTNALSAQNLNIPIQELSSENINNFDHKLRHYDIIVDALFGTGLSKPLTGHMETIINKINQYGKFTVSVDINSGIDADSGLLIGPHVYSDITFALASMKNSHLIYSNALMD